MTRTRALAGMVISVALALPAAAQETTFGHIVALQTGSLGKPFSAGLASSHLPADDTLSVTLDVAFVNSAEHGLSIATNRPGQVFPCKNTSGSYALDPKDTGVKLNESVLLSAYLAGRRVRLTLDGCVFDKPRIISVDLSAANN